MSDISNVILFQIDQASKAARSYSQREMDRLDFGITADQWVLLKIIEESQELSQRELAEKSLRDPASITRTLDILEKKGHITRRPIENNRRQYRIVLTPSGKVFVDKHIYTIETLRKKSTEGFTAKELEQLSDMLRRIRENFS